jgi:hypothetical protein
VKKSDLKDADTAKFLIETVAHTRQTLRGHGHAPTQFGSPQAARRETALAAVTFHLSDLPPLTIVKSVN